MENRLYLNYALEGKFCASGKAYFFAVETNQKVSASYAYGYLFVHGAKTVQYGGNRGGAGARAAGKRFAVTSFPHTHFEGGAVDYSYKFGVYPFGEEGRVFESLSYAFHVGVIYPVHEKYGVGVSYRNQRYVVVVAAYVQDTIYYAVALH